MKATYLIPLLCIICFSVFSINSIYGQDLGPWEKTSLDPEGTQMVNLVVIDDVLYATGWAGLWKKTNGVDEWIKLKDIGLANSFIKHKGKFVLGSWREGIWQSEDLVEWTPIILYDGFQYSSLATDQNDLYASADGGLFKLNEATNNFEKELLESHSIHNSYFPYVLLTEDYAIALGCNFVYYKSKDSTTWNVMNFQFDYCGITAENINGEVYFSTSGNGLFHFVPGEFEVLPVTTPNADELKHVVSIYPLDQVIYFIYLTGLYSSEGFRQEISGNHLSDIVFHEEAFYVSTIADGVWKSTGVVPRNESHAPFSFTIAPSLSSGLVRLQLENLDSEKYKVEVIDMQGRIVQSLLFDNQYNLYNITQSIYINSPGMYIIICSTKNNRKVEKVLIMQ